MREDEDEFHAWCLSEDSENEQWQDGHQQEIKIKMKKFAHEPLLSVGKQFLRVSKESH